MPNLILHKKNSTSGAIPQPAQLALGEIAINTADATWFIKKNNETVINLRVIAAVDGGEITAEISSYEHALLDVDFAPYSNWFDRW